jgi:hypothetical protein
LEEDMLASMRTISFEVKIRGGKCTAGYCVGNKKTNDLMER